MIDSYLNAFLPYFEPFPEAVTYFSRSSNDSFTAYTVNTARRKKTNKNDLSVPPEILQVTELTWQVVSSQLSVEPQNDDYLVDSANVKWTVLHVQKQLHGTVYNLLVRKGV